MTLVMMPRKIMLVIDVSTSMNEPSGEQRTKLEDAKKGAIDFINGQDLSERDEIGLISFSNTADVVCPLGTATLEYIENTVIPAVTSLNVQNNTALWDAIGSGLDILHDRKNGSSLILVVLTDGEDNASTRFPSGAAGCPAIFEYARQKGIDDVRIYIIGVGLLKESEDCLGKLAVATGGQYVPSQANKIPEAFGKVKDHVRDQNQGVPQGSFRRTGQPERPGVETPKEVHPFSHDDAVRAYADRLRGMGHKVRINVSISKRSGKVHVDINDKTDNIYAEIVLGVPDENGLRELIRKLIRLNDVLKGRLKVVFVTSHGNRLPEWFKTVCEEMGIDIDFMDPIDVAVGMMDFTYFKDGTFRKVGYNSSMKAPAFNLIPSEFETSCLNVLVIVPEVVPDKFGQPMKFTSSPCFEKFMSTKMDRNEIPDQMGNKRRSALDTTDHICQNLLNACDHAYYCNEQGKNRKVIVIWSKKMDETGLKYDKLIIDCWNRFKEAMEDLRRRYGTTVEVRIKENI